MGQNSIIIFFFARRAKKALAEGRSPPQELEVGPRSGPYLLVVDTRRYGPLHGPTSSSCRGLRPSAKAFFALLAGIWSCDLRANERPRKKLHSMAQTDTQTHISTDGHGDSMTNSAQWGRVGENVRSLALMVWDLWCFEDLEEKDRSLNK